MWIFEKRKKEGGNPSFAAGSVGFALNLFALTKAIYKPIRFCTE